MLYQVHILKSLCVGGKVRLIEKRAHTARSDLEAIRIVKRISTFQRPPRPASRSGGRTARKFTGGSRRRRGVPAGDKHGADWTFSHPLARAAAIFRADDGEGNPHNVLAIVTTLDLDPKSNNYKKPYVDKLSKAAKKYIADSGDARAFVLMNRPKDWPTRP